MIRASHPRPRRRALALAITAMAALHGCSRRASAPVSDPAAAATPAPPDAPPPGYGPVTIRHRLGTTVIDHLPRRVVALDMNEVDFLDRLGVPVAGMPKDFVPHFLARYGDDPDIVDTGAIVQPNVERVHAARPDLILITSLQARQFGELSRIAPTVHFDVNYQDSRSGHIDAVVEHLNTLGRIFGRQDLAQRKADELQAQVRQARAITRDRPEKALVLLHNNGAFSSFGVQSRYGFVFSELGVRPAMAEAETGLHGQPVSNEFIQQANPDVIYVVDRTAVMEHRTGATPPDNPLLRQTSAWQSGRVIVTDAQAWYVTAASPTSLKLVIDDVLGAYRR